MNSQAIIKLAFSIIGTLIIGFSILGYSTMQDNISGLAIQVGKLEKKIDGMDTKLDVITNENTAQGKDITLSLEQMKDHKLEGHR